MSIELALDILGVVSNLLLLGFGVRELSKGNWPIALVFIGAALASTRIIVAMVIGVVCMLAAVFALYRKGYFRRSSDGA